MDWLDWMRAALPLGLLGGLTVFLHGHWREFDAWLDVLIQGLEG